MFWAAILAALVLILG
jgi:hypothetical protein